MDWQKLLSAMVPVGVGVAAGVSGHPQQGAAFIQGFQGSDQLLWQRRQQEEEAQRRQRALEAEQANREADNTRADHQARLQRLSMALQQLTPAIDQQADYATDPTQAENAVMQRSHQLESSFDLPPSALSGFVPPMQPLIPQAKIRRAKAKYTEFLDRYDDKKGRAREAENSFTFHEGEFAGMTPAQVRELAAMILPVPRDTPKITPPTPGTFEEYVGLPPEQQGLRRRQRKEWAVSDNQPTSPPSQAISAAREALLQSLIADRELTGQARRLRQLGLDPEVEIAKARRQMEESVRQLEKELPESYSGERGDPAQYQERLTRARQMLRQTVTGGGSGQPPQAIPTPAPTSDGTITRQELRSVAARLGISEQQAEQQAKQRGLSIVP